MNIHHDLHNLENQEIPQDNNDVRFIMV